MDIEDLQRLNDNIYARCPECHKDLVVIEQTSNRWLHRLVGADRLTVRRCPDHDYTRIDKLNSKEGTIWELHHGEVVNNRSYYF